MKPYILKHYPTLELNEFFRYLAYFDGEFTIRLVTHKGKDIPNSPVFHFDHKDLIDKMDYDERHQLIKGDKDWLNFGIFTEESAEFVKIRVEEVEGYGRVKDFDPIFIPFDWQPFVTELNTRPEIDEEGAFDLICGEHDLIGRIIPLVGVQCGCRNKLFFPWIFNTSFPVIHRTETRREERENNDGGKTIEIKEALYLNMLIVESYGKEGPNLGYHECRLHYSPHYNPDKDVEFEYDMASLPANNTKIDIWNKERTTKFGTDSFHKSTNEDLNHFLLRRCFYPLNVVTRPIFHFTTDESTSKDIIISI